MDYSMSFAISAAGMRQEQMRLNIASMNLANANASAADVAHLYRPLRLIGGVISPNSPFAPIFEQMLSAFPLGRPAAIVPTDANPRLAYEPGHPQANEQGQVMYPGVDTLAEVLSIMTAVRGYEANVLAFNATKVMAQRALEIGSGR